jgi:hypothetical protein
MSNMIFKSGFLPVLALLVTGCTETVSTPSGAGSLADGRYCYRIASIGAGVSDSEELLVEIENRNATGEYNWIPQMKDARRGFYNGTVSGRTVNAEYRFTQEGMAQSAGITIILSADRAVVTGVTADAGLDSTLPQVPC